jgi:hypothetical protein
MGILPKKRTVPRRRKTALPPLVGMWLCLARG